MARKQNLEDISLPDDGIEQSGAAAEPRRVSPAIQPQTRTGSAKPTARKGITSSSPVVYLSNDVKEAITRFKLEKMLEDGGKVTDNDIVSKALLCLMSKENKQLYEHYKTILK